jgi:xanthine/uracil/vitamin C permease (AzgA family)
MGPGESETQTPAEPPGLASVLDRTFGLSAAGTTMPTELRAGLATFLTMAYIMFVNPAILEKAGMDHGAVFVATCLAAALSTAIMGLYANYPIALAPGMGLNAYFAFTMVRELGGNWQLALGIVFLSGALFLLISLTPLREWLINAIPLNLKLGIAAGIGLFLALIGCSMRASWRRTRPRWSSSATLRKRRRCSPLPASSPLPDSRRGRCRAPSSSACSP